MFDKFESRVVVTGVLICEGPLCIRAEPYGEVGGPELPAVKDFRGRPFVPGSSIKGTLRSFLESVVRAGAGDQAACDPFDARGTCQTEQTDGTPCLVCAVFGSRTLASHVRFDDSTVIDWFPRFDVRGGLPVGRDQLKGEGRTGYELETVPEGTTFSFRVSADNCPDWGLGMVALGISALEQQRLRIGSGASRGLGSVSLKDVHYRGIMSVEALLGCLDQESSGDGDILPQSMLDEWRGAFRRKLKEAAHVQETGE